MRITPRREEIDRVVRILECDEFTGAEQMAKDLIKEVAEMLWMRDWFALVHLNRDGTKGLNWAPFSSPIEAFRTAARIGVGGRFGTVKLYSPGRLLANTEGKPGWPGFCQNDGCGHAPWTHAMVGAGRGRCVLSPCDCARFRKEK